MRYLKSLWRLWYDIWSFEWLDRLSQFSPRLAWSITCMMYSAWMFALAWFYLDPRVRVYTRHGSGEESWSYRIVMGVIPALAGLVPLVFRIDRDQCSIELRWNPFKRKPGRPRKDRSG